MTKFQSIKELEKGCGEEFMWIEYFKDKRTCGQMEDLKHSEHIILCSECKAKLSQNNEILKLIDEIRKNTTNDYFIEELKSKIIGEQKESD